MRIVEQTPERLHVRHRPWFAWGVMALLIGGSLWEVLTARLGPVDHAIYAAVLPHMAVLAWWFLPVIALTFDRASGTVTFRETRLIGSKIRRFAMSEVF